MESNVGVDNFEGDVVQRIILTGGSDGLGKEFAKLCINDGIEVVCLSRNKPDYPCIYIKTDLADENSIIAAVDIIKGEYGSFNALVNCAGVINIGDTENITYDALDKLMKVNLMAPIFLTSKLLGLIKENNADILNVGSTAGTKGNIKECMYGSSKWGLRGVSKSLQAALANTKCRVMQFNPGGMSTRFFDKFSKGLVDVNAFMNPVDVAGVMLYSLKLPKQIEISEIIINRKSS